jgi:hypothetical protein
VGYFILNDQRFFHLLAPVDYIFHFHLHYLKNSGYLFFMNRSELIKASILACFSFSLSSGLLSHTLKFSPVISKNDFGKDFVWEAATAAYQIEGAWNEQAKGESI